ncbi:DUF323 domain-containing protein [Punctularia strigosozonata HHB-11173 SS5]|uniref:DUF323 domain-containing protein n=1 Tax=Punctularia strigosozonata (strain HHB-11173) TaxID=741275 RepID=UPI00044163B1|nr:DUF323 domain-containing protein [Punctularia strigosozonata HHB-11173 SS5]EIN13018.1 DUF323 domain-containing protein [Punctularia strigosozonata HHB-11173 SS5]
MPEHTPIVDVRVKDATRVSSLRQDILDGLARPPHHRTLPTLLLYNERGLRLYDDITTGAPEYYLFGAEEQILKEHADDVVRAMESGHADAGGQVVLELGAGALRKTSLVLDALARAVAEGESANPISYYALDLEERELKRTLQGLSESEIGPRLADKVALAGMLGEYQDGIKFVEQGGLRGRDSVPRMTQPYALGRLGRNPSPSSSASDPSEGSSKATSHTAPSTPDQNHGPLHILFLGSSLGNFLRGEDAAFLRSLPLRAGSGDTLLLGLDHDNDARKIELAYNDPKRFTEKFIMNGLRTAGEALGDDKLFDEAHWEYVNRYDIDERQHEAYFRSKQSQTVMDPKTRQSFHFEAGELLKIEVSTKFSDKDAYTLFAEADLRPIQRWTDDSRQYSLWLLERPPFLFPLLKSPTVNEVDLVSPFNLPSVHDWRCMWAAWDFVTREMIPPSMLYQKPIDLRHICLFYCGHIPTFLDIHLSRLLGEAHTEPEEYKYIFERGIDPNVDDPTQCHSHSEVPTADDDWPSLSAILDFQDRVRDRLLRLYADFESGKKTLTRKMARVLFMTFEHEGFHAETLLYMLIQRAGTGTLPPIGFTKPEWSSLQKTWGKMPQPAERTVTLGPADVVLGHDDIEAEDNDPKLATDLKGHSFGWDNESPRRTVHVNEFRIEWRPITNEEFYEFYNGPGKGKVKYPASWVKVGNETQVRTLYGPVPIKVGWNWPVVTSYDDLSTYAIVKGGRIPTEAELRLFYDKFVCGYEGGANVGFRNWHPVPATAGGDGKGQKGHNGGVWEWTSTVFDEYPGFVPSVLYPGYSLDFFDGRHQVVIGGSYATIPRIADRRTVRNFYQRNYPYAWCGARVAYNI